MAVSTTVLNSPFGATIYVDTDCDATAEADIGSGAKTIYQVDINNPGTAKVYFKAWDHASPTVGTTVPNLVLPVAIGERTTYSFPEGLVFATGLSIACVTAAGTGGTTNPASDVTVKIHTN